MSLTSVAVSPLLFNLKLQMSGEALLCQMTRNTTPHEHTFQECQWIAVANISLAENK